MSPMLKALTAALMRLALCESAAATRRRLEGGGVTVVVTSPVDHLKWRVPQLLHTGNEVGQPSGPHRLVSISRVELPAMRKDIVEMFVTS